MEKIDCTGVCDEQCAATAIAGGGSAAHFEEGFGQGMVKGMLTTTLVIGAITAAVYVGRAVSARLRRRQASAAAEMPSAHSAQFTGF
mmetsp:Transcript_28003/g.70474  ORF Transcript_28003/g.70474 Transcript_28003/m.70474 type:complete len:87 (-) Transcript_28003:268-528(-)